MDAPTTPAPEREVWSPLDKKIIKFLKCNPVMYSYVKPHNPTDIQSADKLWNVLAAETDTTVTDLQNRWNVIQEKCQQWVNDVLESELSNEDEEIIDCLLVIYGQITKLNESRNKKGCVVFSKTGVHSSSKSLSSQREGLNKISNNDHRSIIEPIPSTSKSFTQNVDEEVVEVSTYEIKNNDNIVTEMEDIDLNSEEELRDLTCEEDIKSSDDSCNRELVNLDNASDHSNLNDGHKEIKEKLLDIRPANSLPNLPEVQEDTTIFFEKLGVYVDKELSAKKQRELRLKIWSMITNAELEMLNEENKMTE